MQKVVGAGPASCASIPLGRARGFQVGWLPHSGRVLRGRVSMWGPLEGLSWYPVGGEISLLPLLSEHMGVLTLGTVSWSLCPPRLGSVLVCSGRGVCVVAVPVAHGSFLCSLAGVLLLVRTFQVRICLSLSESRASLMKTWLFLKRVCPLCRLLQGMVGESLPPSILFPKWGEGEFEKWGLGWPSPHGSGQHPSHSFACSFIHPSLCSLGRRLSSTCRVPALLRGTGDPAVQTESWASGAHTRGSGAGWVGRWHKRVHEGVGALERVSVLDTHSSITSGPFAVYHLPRPQRQC